MSIAGLKRTARGPVPGAVARMVGVMRENVWGLAFFTFVVDVLLLVQPLYMLQVYDRVLASSSVETLVFISVIAAGALLLLGFVDTLRSMMAGRIAARLDVEAGADALVASINGQRASLGDVQPLRDLATVRGFIANRGILAYFDLPFAPLFIGLLYFIHPDLFWLTVGGAVVLSLLAFANQVVCNRAASDGGDRAMGALLSAQVYARNAESLGAMGMVGNVINAWGREEAASLQAQERNNAANAMFAGVSRVLRMGLQIAILGYGGYLVLAHEMTAGMIFASSLISGRGLQPIDQVIGGWKGFVDTTKAWKRLCTAFERVPDEAQQTELPVPEGRLTMEQVVVFAGAAGAGAEPLLKRVSAEIRAGDCVAVIGPSGAGKSTLARAIVGALRLHSGTVRIDGADIRTWSRERLGRHLGYLAQDVELLPGTIAQNIARFDPEAVDTDIVAAAVKAQVHDLVLSMPQGYDTLIGPAGQQLSGGQRQRIGLARAFFGQPRLLVLDEPNANLDSAGDVALEQALARAKADGVTVVIVTQRRAVVDKADRVLMLREGAVEDYGGRLEVIQRQAQKMRATDPAAQREQMPVRLPQSPVTASFGAVMKGGGGAA